jgi:Ca2+-transporting ATPase
MNRSVSEPLGLGSSEAMSRLASEGYNELPSAKPRSLLAIAWEVVREPMFLLLIGASAIYLVLGDLREAMVLFASVFVVMGITFHQERKTERALEALRGLSSPRAHVLRDGEWQLVPGREVVVGDLVRVKEGDRVPADAALLRAGNLMADESLLTGESMPVRKRASATEPKPVRPGGDDLPFVYSGTLLTQGHCVARVVATGARTEIGKIGKALQILVPEPSGIQRETRRAVLIFAAIGLALCVLVTVLYGLRHGDWLNGLLAGITLAMANLPEEFPVVLTVFLALGAWRISQHGVLTRRAPAIETLGSTTVLCVDKTGTLTQNRMAVQRLWLPGKEIDLQVPDDKFLSELIEFSVLASEREPFDPMEKAYHRLAQERAPAALGRLGAWTLKHSYPLLPEQLSVAHIWQPQGGDRYIVAAKGAPEAIADLCALDGGQRAAMHAQVAEMARDGLRVLAVAKGTLLRTDEGTDPWPGSQSELRVEFVGLTGLADPIRPAVPTALRECYAAGIRTVMITGDFPGTAQAIALQIGLANPENVVTGSELDSMSDAQLRERLANVNIFARVVPEQKLRLVQAFKANGEIVAMTGDGVNDAPALKAAHIGVAMGKRGSDVAREAASLVLLEDDFTSIVEAVKLGRRIFDNIQKATCYIIAVHVPTAGMALLPLLFGWPLVFYPVHIVFLEFVIDPACSIAFEAEPAENDVMRRPPRPATSRLFNGWSLATSVLQGASLLIAVALLYALVLASGTPEPQARAMAFAAVVLGNVGLILSNRSRQAPLLATLRRPNPALWWIAGGALLGLGLALYVEPMLEIFRFAPLSGYQLLMSVAAAAVGLTWLELYKWLRPYSVQPRRASVRGFSKR